MSILVSVVIPTYKRSVEFLSRAVESVLNQTYQNIEIIVVDDNPAFPEIRKNVENYIRELNSDKVIYHQNEKNLGGSLTRNAGVDLAHGEYIAFLDDDDEFMEDKVEKQLQFMLDTDCDLSFSDMIMYNNAGQVVDYRDYNFLTDFDNHSLLKAHITRNISGTSSFIFRTSKLREIGKFTDAPMGQDFLVMLKSIEGGLKIRYFNECHTIIYKHNEGAISNGMNKVNGEKNLYEFRKKYFGILSPEERRFINFRHYAVMVVAYRRNSMYLHMVGAAFQAFFSSPKIFFSEVFGFISKVFSHRKTDGSIQEIRSTSAKADKEVIAK
ncbi:MAG: glycosyltransferase [Clostridia bacterium]|nr:glycosyltransferase [Clostridia bacterium]